MEATLMFTFVYEYFHSMQFLQNSSDIGAACAFGTEMDRAPLSGDLLRVRDTSDLE